MRKLTIMNGKRLLSSPLVKTRSCRVVIPRLKTWTGERVVVTEGGLLFQEGQKDLTESFFTDKHIRRSIRDVKQQNCRILLAYPQKQEEFLGSSPVPSLPTAHSGPGESPSSRPDSQFSDVYDSGGDHEIKKVKRARVVIKRMKDSEMETSRSCAGGSANTKKSGKSSTKKKKAIPQGEKALPRLLPPASSVSRENSRPASAPPMNDSLANLETGKLLVLRHQKTIRCRTVYEENGRRYKVETSTVVQNVRTITKGTPESSFRQKE